MITRWYHGGFPDLRVGDYIRPPAETGRQAWPDGGDLAGLRTLQRRHVYISASAGFGAMHAIHRPGSLGWLYRVEPEGELGDDPERGRDAVPRDWARTCGRARIVAVEARTRDELAGFIFELNFLVDYGIPFANALALVGNASAASRFLARLAATKR